MVVDRFRDFQAAAAHVADSSDRPEESRDHPQSREPRFFGALEDSNLETAFRLDRRGELRAVGGATHGFGRHGVDSADAHGVGDGAKPSDGLDGAPKAVGGDDAGLGQSVCEAEEGLFIEARHWRPAELVIDQEPDRVRANVDNCVGRTIGPRGAPGIELERPRRRLRLLSASLAHRVSSRCELHGEGRASVTSLSFLQPLSPSSSTTRFRNRWRSRHSSGPVLAGVSSIITGPPELRKDGQRGRPGPLGSPLLTKLTQ
jgi:hypothetical protein